MKRILVAGTILMTFSCSAQDAPTAVTNAFSKNFPGTTVKKWDKEDGAYEANFSKSGKTMSATFSENGVLEETETDIKTSDLPPSITSYIQTHYKGANIKEAAMIVKGKENMYEAEVKGKDLLFDISGKFLKEQED